MKIFTYECIVIGSGAAGYNAACRLKRFGKNVAIVTENVNCGTSRNAGSDKQTYYKLGLGGSFSDSVGKMAEDLFSGGCVDGDNALCEAALSPRCFMNLCELGVKFPVDRYGGYVGYKTDHDPYSRATSAGPLTSKEMTEALQKQAESLGIEVFDGFYVFKLLKNKGAVCGAVCINVNDGQLTAFRCGSVILATGGPAGIYSQTSYPEGHFGATGLAIEVGARLQNLELWQYGIASVRPKWNVSGTYMQVLPRFVSIGDDGEEHDFLLEYFTDPYECLSLIFLKGYQWPYDTKRAENGSSVIDVLVHRERVERKRRVYLDFTKNAFDIDFKKLSEEAFAYLCNAGATFGTPFERLMKMNPPAVELYKSKGVDLSREYLEIALCAQHHNGGIAVDCWWQSSVEGLFAVGECAGTHGISRPGGAALNAGQVGSLRAATYISRYGRPPVDESAFNTALSQINVKQFIKDDTALESARKRMSENAAAIRDTSKIKELLLQTLSDIHSLDPEIYDPRLRDVLVTQAAVLTSMACPPASPSEIRETVLTETGFETFLRPVRPIPDTDGFFENVWRGYRENGNVF